MDRLQAICIKTGYLRAAEVSAFLLPLLSYRPSPLHLQGPAFAQLTVLAGMASTVDHQPPIHYRPRSNEVPCGGFENVDDGCQGLFTRMEAGRKLCFLCAKLKDSNNSATDVAEIQVDFFPSASFAS